MPASDLLALCAWSQAVSCFFAGTALYSLFRQGHLAAVEGSTSERDLGFRFLALGVWVWSLMAFFMMAHESKVASISLRLLSILNSALFLIAATWLDVAPDRFRNRRPALRIQIVTLSIITAVLSLSLTSFGPALGIPPGATLIPELLLSLGTITVLCFGLWQSFLQRGFGTLAYLALFTFCGHIAAQLAIVFSEDGQGGAFSSTLTLILVLCSKIMIVSLFLALAISWLSERLQKQTATMAWTPQEAVPRGGEAPDLDPGENNVALILKAGENPGEYFLESQRQGVVIIHKMNKAHFSAVLELSVERKIQATHNEAGWILPKDMESSRDKKPETTSAYLSRVNKELGFELIEVRDGQRRLSLPPSHFAIHANVLHDTTSFAEILNKLTFAAD